MKMTSNGKNFELQSYRSRRKLKFSYKVYLHPSSNKKIQIFEIFEKRLGPTAVAHGGRRCYGTVRLLPLTPCPTAPDV
jgi:hypothetical protein